MDIPGQDTTYNPATSTVDGLMSVADKTKLDGMDPAANRYSHPMHDAHSLGLYTMEIDSQGHVSQATKVIKKDITNLGIP